MKLSLRLLFILLLFSCGFPLSALHAQGNYHATQLIPTLAPSEVCAILTDHQGLLWIGTSDGLLSFDGHTITNHTNTAAARSLMRSVHILSLAETKDH